MHDLDRLVTAAATLDPDDHASAVRLREQAHRTTRRLADAGRLPPHLVVGSDDGIAVVIRTLATAQRVLTARDGRSAAPSTADAALGWHPAVEDRRGTPLSRHVTSEGVVTYARDTDGRLVVQLDRWPPTTTLRRTVEGTRADTGSARRTCA
jgi:hypothetical protein